MPYCTSASTVLSSDFDLGPQRAHREDFARDRVGARDRGGIGVGFLLRARDEHRAPCGSRGCWWSAVATISRRSRCRGISRAYRLRIGAGEVTLHFAREIRIVGQIGIEQVIAEPDLAVRQHHRELGAREAEALLAALEEFVVARQELDGAIQVCRRVPARGSGSGIRSAARARAVRAPTTPGSADSCCAARAGDLVRHAGE